MKPGRTILTSLVAMCALAVTSPGQFVLPPHSMVAGKTLEEWSTEWWIWAHALEAPGHPWFDETGTNALAGQSGRVFYLVGAFNESGTVTRSIKLPEGKYLFFPMLNFYSCGVFQDPFGTVTEELRDGDLDLLSRVTGLYASLNGQPLTNLLYTTGQRVTNLLDHLERSPEFKLWLPASNNVVQFFGFDVSGYLEPAVADGYWIMLKPLPVGTYVLRFGGSMGPPSNMTLDITYHITVEQVTLSRRTTDLITYVEKADLSPARQHVLEVSLEAAVKHFDANRVRPGVNQLRMFQKKVRAQIGPIDPALADELTVMAREIIEAAEKRAK